MDNEYKHLAYFLGPKSENSDILESLMSGVLHDNADWRRNYYPDDDALIDETAKNDLKDEYASLTKNVNEMMVEMRKNIPFQSPRYIAHMLSDTTLPALIGYMAGLLYNANNVTTEAAPVTVNWEIQACNRILEMLGYVAPPDTNANDENFDMGEYLKSIEKPFGWAHITAGGTSSNLEALWVARNIKYLALAIHDIAFQKNLSISVKQANGIEKSILEFDEKEVLLIKPEDAINLLSSYLESVSKKLEHIKHPGESPSDKAWEWLNGSQYSLVKGTGNVFKKHPPVIFVSGASHYSIDKAADILGVGKENICNVQMDSNFRMDVRDLEKKVKRALLQGKIPLAVIAIAGTTEEGAVDPVHDIVNLRNKLEFKSNASFWLHIDGAWGGYMRSLFSPSDSMNIFISISEQLGLPFDGDISKWNEMFFFEIEKKVALLSVYTTFKKDQAYNISELNMMNELTQLKDELVTIAKKDDFESYLNKINYLNGQYQGIWIFSSENTSNLSIQAKIAFMKTMVTEQISIEHGNYKEEIKICWGDNEVLSFYIAFPAADSITIDAHKMGYVPYSCGLIAYKDDRIRSFIYQKAPYIAGTKNKSLIHYPPKYVVDAPSLDEDYDVKYLTKIESFAPFTLEGSKSGASASSLWLATKTIPLTLSHHGAIVKSSLLAARELYEWLTRWNQITIDNNNKFEFIPLVNSVPDTNVINFIVRNNSLPTLAAANDLTMKVYKSFAIKIEDGEWDISKNQPFFLSNTRFDAPKYSLSTLQEFFRNNKLKSAEDEYKKNGLTVIRATVMNPYINAVNKNSKENYFGKFMESISEVAEKYFYESQEETWLDEGCEGQV